MAESGGLSLLVPVDVSTDEAPDLAVLDHLGATHVVLLGVFLVPDQAEPALIRDEYEAAAAARLDDLAAGHPADVETVLVFTHDRGATVDRVAEEHGCDAVLTPGPLDALDRVLVPLRGEVNLERILAVVADLYRACGASVTLFHAAVEDADPSHGELLLRGAAERLTEFGVATGRIDRELSAAGDPVAAIVEAGAGFDLVVFGETEPSLRERIMGDALSRMVDGIDRPALVVRRVEP